MIDIFDFLNFLISIYTILFETQTYRDIVKEQPGGKPFIVRFKGGGAYRDQYVHVLLPPSAGQSVDSHT